MVNNYYNFQNFIDFNGDLFDCFSLENLSSIYEEQKNLRLSFYVACIVDKNDNFCFVKASEIAKWYLNYKKEIVPTNRQEIKDFAIYQLNEQSLQLQIFCRKIQLETQPFFAALIAINDPNLSPLIKAEMDQVLANCYYFGEGGAPEDQEKALFHANRFLKSQKIP